MHHESIDLDGDVLHFVDFGGAGSTIVLVHGLGGSHNNWLAVGRALAEHGRVVALDLPGFGLSPRVARGASVDVLGDALARFVDAISPEPVHLIGNSLGGALSLLEASRRPERVRSTLLACPALPPVAGARPSPRFLLTLALSCAPFGATLLRRRARKAGPRQMVHELLSVCCVDPARVPRDVVEAHVELARTRASRPWVDQAFSEAARSVLALALSPSYSRKIRALAVPTLIVHGVEDRLVDVRASRAAVAAAPQIQLTELADVGHVPQLEVPDRFVEIAARWLAKHDDPRPRAARGENGGPAA